MKEEHLFSNEMIERKQEIIGRLKALRDTMAIVKYRIEEAFIRGYIYGATMDIQDFPSYWYNEIVMEVLK